MAESCMAPPSPLRQKRDSGEAFGHLVRGKLSTIGWEISGPGPLGMPSRGDPFPVTKSRMLSN
eukprot:2457870-Pyramimonas_sp.AAC.1